MEKERLIFHVDVNSAFISWESVRRVAHGESDLRLVPAVVGGNPENRSSIVTTKSIPAKAYGINTGEPVSMAIRKCPELIWVESDFKWYVECSKAFKDICREYSSEVESFSIDEVFMDMTDMRMLYPDPIKTAYEIKDRIKEELGFTVNVGIGNNKLLAKMASDFEKPDKVHTLFYDEIKEKMWPLPVGELFMVGKSSANKLTTCGISTIGELAGVKPELLKGILGERGGEYAYNAANGIDNNPVCARHDDAKSYSVESTFEYNVEDLATIHKVLLSQADIVATRIRKDGVKTRQVAVTYRTHEFKNRNHQKKLYEQTDVTDEIYRMACQLFEECWDNTPVRLVGISLSDVSKEEDAQLSLFVDEKKEKLKKLDGALDSIRGKYGNKSVQRASTVDVNPRIGRKYN